MYSSLSQTCRDPHKQVKNNEKHVKEPTKLIQQTADKKCGICFITPAVIDFVHVFFFFSLD